MCPTRNVLAALFVSLLAACGGTEAGGIAGPAPTGAPAASASPSACNTLVAAGGAVSVMADPSDAPAPTGGDITSGTYELTRATLYTGQGGASGSTGQTQNMTIRMNGRSGESLLDGKRSNASYVPHGSELDIAVTCPLSASETAAFSATGSSLTIFTAFKGGTLVQVFARVAP